MLYNFLNKTSISNYTLKFIKNNHQKNIRKIKFLKIIVKKSSFKFKKSREQYALKNNINITFFKSILLFSKLFEFFFLFYTNFTNTFNLKINKKETFNLKY